MEATLTTDPQFYTNLRDGIPGRRRRRRDNSLYLVSKVGVRLSGHWRGLNGGENLMALVLVGCRFKNGVLPRREVHQLATAAD